MMVLSLDTPTLLNVTSVNVIHMSL